MAEISIDLGGNARCKDIVLIYVFHNLVLQEYLVLTESSITLKPVLGGLRIIALSITSHGQTQYT